MSTGFGLDVLYMYVVSLLYVEGKGGACVCVYVGSNGAVNRAASVANVSSSTSKYPSTVRVISLHSHSPCTTLSSAKLTLVCGYLHNRM